MKAWRITLVLLTIALAALYVFNLAGNPPGFFIDESSIAYNAHSVATSGLDEHGVRLPLYFRAFGDYKNPTFIYLLAAMFWFTGPSILVARLLSAIAGIAAAAVIGILATRLTRNRVVGWASAASALLTPWLFETSRVALEVALYPLVFALFLLSAHRATSRGRWSGFDVVCVAGTLALLTYTYSIGRLLGPLLAAGLLLLANRASWRRMLLTWVAYGVTLIPLFAFNRTHPNALTGRFGAITYLQPNTTAAEAAGEFAIHYLSNLDVRRLLLTGNPNPDLYGIEHFLAGTFVFTLVGLLVVLRNHLQERWWRFFFYAAAAAPIPASLTTDNFHVLRLIAMPVVLLVLAGTGMAWMADAVRARATRLVFSVLLVATLMQGAGAQWRYHRSVSSAHRIDRFDGAYREKIFAPATAADVRSIHIADAPAIPGYMQAYWYALLAGIDRSRFTLLAPEEPPPVGALVISTEPNCVRCEVLAYVEPYTLYFVHAPPRDRQPLPRDAMAAELALLSGPQTLRRREKAEYRVRVKNVSAATWSARERSASPLQVSLGNHWQATNGDIAVNDDGRAALLHDLEPGAEAELQLVVNAPPAPGEYLLEFDMLQEGVAWFAAAGSQVVRIPVSVQ